MQIVSCPVAEKKSWWLSQVEGGKTVIFLQRSEQGQVGGGIQSLELSSAEGRGVHC